MKNALYFGLILLLALARPALADEPQWWSLPYPGRFDAATLAVEQPAITIEGKDFVTSGGEPFVFRGVNIADPAKLSAQGHWDRRLFEEVRSWGANTVRLPIHPVAWRERGADWVFAHIDEAVQWCNQMGMYLIIDWHSIGNLEAGMFQHPMYDTSVVETANFWRSVAWRYRDVPTVAVYELFNEPTDNYIGAGPGSLGKASWDSWREQMEDLIDLLRVYDPGSIPLVAGFNWAYDLASVAEQPIRRDRVAYAIHPYPQKALPSEPTRDAQFALWQEQWGWVAERYPLIASELGWVAEDGYNPHIPVIDNEGRYGPLLVEFMEARGISWTVWNFDPDWAPTMISDWEFTPTEQGRFFRYVLQRLDGGSLPLSALPAPRLTEYEWMSIARWRQMFAEDVAIAAAGDVDLLLLGDSITEMWPDSAWQGYFAPLNAANFGIGGDRTENVLWRLQNGATGILQPRTVVLMIGVNNFGLRGDTPAQVYEGVAAVVAQLRESFPEARILLLGILPYGEQPQTPERQAVGETNRLISSLAAEPQVEFHDIGAAFLEADGSIAPSIMADFLHPTEQGYEVFAEQLLPMLND